MLTNLQAATIERFGIERGTQAEARRIAGKIFDRAYERGKWRQRWARITGKANALRSLTYQPVTSRRESTTMLVPLSQIVGTECRSEEFDRDFHPLQTHSRERWIGVAAARRTGVVLPLVELVRAKDGYYVRDGHHRISVARAMGQLAIEARVVN
jgi:hypothetical protein